MFTITPRMLTTHMIARIKIITASSFYFFLRYCLAKCVRTSDPMKVTPAISSSSCHIVSLNRKASIRLAEPTKKMM
jgi:hypothetical protein